MSGVCPSKRPMSNGNGGRRTSQVLQDLVSDTSRSSISFHEISKAVGERAIGALLVLFALPNLIPIPGISTIFGLLIGIVAIQLVVGSTSVWLPRQLRERTVSREALTVAIERALPRMERLEKLLRPRWTFLCVGFGERLIGVACIAMALILMLPLVLNNLFPALAVLAFALGLIERDGLAIVVGYGLGVLAILILGVTLAVGTAAMIGFLKGIVYIFDSVPT
jgi:hypothetical protein